MVFGVALAKCYQRMFKPALYVLKENDYPQTKLFYAVKLHYFKYNIYIYILFYIMF